MAGSESQTKAITRYEILSVVGSCLLLVASLLVYFILKYIQTTYGTIVLPSSEKFEIPTFLAVSYYVILAIGAFCVGAASLSFEVWFLNMTQLEDYGRDSGAYKYVQYAAGLFLYSIVFFAPFCAVFFQPIGHYSQVGGPYTPMEWEIGNAALVLGLFFGFILLPVIGIVAIRSFYAKKNRLKRLNVRIGPVALSSAMVAVSMFSLAIALLAGSGL